MSGVKMLVSAKTDVGRARQTNEDAFAITDLASGRRIEAIDEDHAIDVHERGVLLAVSDGMGGAEAGEVASALVLDSLQRALSTEGKGAIHEQLEAAVQRANRNVFLEAMQDNKHGMGATLTALFVRGDEAYIAEVGDSRGYLLRNGRLRQITRDQSLVQLLVDHGVLSAEEARRSSSKNVILQAMGLALDVRVAIARLRLRRGDRFILCSDGVSNPLTDAELQQIATQSDPRAACETIIALANDRGGDDNETVIVADVTGEGLPLPDEFETVTETYEVLKQYSPTYRGRAVTPDVARVAAAALRAREAAEAGGSEPPPVRRSSPAVAPVSMTAPMPAPIPSEIRDEEGPAVQVEAGYGASASVENASATTESGDTRVPWARRLSRACGAWTRELAWPPPWPVVVAVVAVASFVLAVALIATSA